MSAIAVARANGAAPPSGATPEMAVLVAAAHASDDQARSETVPERRVRWERVRNRQLSLMLTRKGWIDRLDLTAAQEGDEVAVGVRFPGEQEGGRFHVRLQSLDQDARTAVQLALIGRGLAAPARVVLASGA